jgi:hypothetical protein
LGIKKQVFLYLSHRISKPIIKEYMKIRDAAEGIGGDTFFLYHARSDEIQHPLEAIINCYRFTDKGMSELNYPMIGRKMIPGHCHFPLFLFFRDYPDYDFYWIIEYDVRFSGDWRFFFNSFEEVDRDYLACHIREFSREPEWIFWTLQHPEKSVPIHSRFRSFNPIYRLSRRSLEFMELSLRDGWCGHQEVVLPTLLFNNGFTMMDFGGSGRFTLPGMENRFYISPRPKVRGTLTNGTMRWRPIFRRTGTKANKLYHPVKPLPFFLLENFRFYLERFLGVRRFFK